MSSIKDRMKKFLPGKVYKRFTGLISPCGDEYAALYPELVARGGKSIKAAEKVFINHGRPRGSARRFYTAWILEDECSTVADMVLSDKSLSYDTVIDAFRVKALEDVSASIVRDYLDD